MNHINWYALLNKGIVTKIAVRVCGQQILLGVQAKIAKYQEVL
jgi:hypothetical protein